MSFSSTSSGVGCAAGCESSVDVAVSLCDLGLMSRGGPDAEATCDPLSFGGPVGVSSSSWVTLRGRVVEAVTFALLLPLVLGDDVCDRVGAEPDAAGG